MTISLRRGGLLLTALFFLGLTLLCLSITGARRDGAQRFGIAAPLRHEMPAGAAIPAAFEGISARMAPSAAPATAVNYAALPMAFEANRGQTAQSVRFLARGRGYGLFLTSDEAVLSLHPSQSGADGANTDRVLRMRLIGGKRAAQVTGAGELPGRSHYFIGSDSKQWRRDVPNYGKVLYRGVYPGIDLVYYGKQRQLEYDFIVAPGADPSLIQLAFSGVQNARLNARGDLVFGAGSGAIVHQAPIIYQNIDGQRKSVQGRFELSRAAGFHRVSFRFGAYDKSRPLIIDPVLSYASYFGGTGTDIARDIAVDSNGNSYLVGETASTNFPLRNAQQPTSAGKSDVFVSKIDAAGTGLIYSTYIGGIEDDFGNDIAIDSTGSAYVTGETKSIDYPSVRALSGLLFGGRDAFVTKLSASGSALAYSTKLGGLADDTGNGIDVDSSGAAYVVGTTASSNFPTLLALRFLLGGLQDAFVSKIDPAGSSLAYSTYLGGSDSDEGNAIVVDSAGSAILTGATDSLDFPTSRALQPALNSKKDAFITALDARGSGLVFSTYLGGTKEEFGRDITLDDSSNITIVGQTISVDFPTVNALQVGTQNNAGSTDVFVSQLAAGGSALTFSTYLGGSGSDVGQGVAVDATGLVHVVGETGSTDFPVVSAIQSTNRGFNDGFTSTLNPATGTLLDSSYLGGDRNDGALGVAVDNSDGVRIVGYTDSDNFPKVNALQPNRAGVREGFFAKVEFSLLSARLSLSPSSFSEASGNGAAIGTITLSSAATTAVTFTLSSSNPGKVTVPASVTLAAGATSATFALNAVDNAVVDGDATVRIAAAAAGYTSTSATVSVTDDDVPALSLSINPTTFNEADGTGAATATLRRNTSTATALTVNVSSSNSSKVTVPATVTLPIGADSVTFAVNARDNALVDGTVNATITAGASGFSAATATVSVTDNDVPTLTITINPATFSEGVGDDDDGDDDLPTVTIRRNTSTQNSLTVQVSSSDPARLPVSSTVTIPAGSATVTFTIDPIDNNVVDGTSNITLTASAAGFVADTAVAAVTDNDVPTLTIRISPSTFSEADGPGAATVTVTRNTSTVSALPVRLVSSNPARLPVRDNIAIASGRTSVSFLLDALDNAIAEGNSNVTITASSPGFNSPSVVVTVTDDDVPTLSLSLTLTSISENAGANAARGHVSRNTPTDVSLSVSLSSSNTNKVRVPSTVTIPAGRTGVDFEVAAVDNLVVDGTQTVSVRASRSGFLGDSVTISVTDDDIAPTPTPVPTRTPTPGPTATPTPRPTATATPGPTATATPGPTATATPRPTATATPRPTATATPRPTATATPGPTPTAAPNQSTLSLQITPSRFSENAGSRAATVVLRRTAPATASLTVRLLSSNTNKVRVPATVTLPANVLSANFFLTAVNNDVVDGNQAVTITATATGVRSATATVTITDDDVPRLSLVVQPATFSEVAGLTAASVTVRRNTPTNVALRVTLSSSNVAAVRVPATVTIPVGAASVSFRIQAIDDSLVNGTRRVTITAASSGFIAATATVSVTDNDRVAPTPTPTTRPTATPQPTPTARPTATPISPLHDWGLNESGQLGDGTRIDKNVPQQVRGFGNLIAIDANGSHSLAVTGEGKVLSWGFNRYGELGDGSTTNRATPVMVQGLSDVSAVAAGWYHSLALKRDGTVWAWGYNSRGQLGDGTALDRRVPVQVRGLSGVRFIAAGVYHNLAILRDGTVWAWGANEAGQLGDGSTNDRRFAVRLNGLSAPREVAAGSAHSLALLSDGSVLAWGANQFGQLGNRSNNRSSVPVAVRGLTGVVAVVAGYVHNVALLSGGRAVAWGNNFYGQLGDNSTEDRNVPAAVQNLSNVRSLAAGTGHTLALLNDGTLRAWGWNEYGQVGDGSRDDRRLPVAVRNLSRVTAIAAGYAHNLVLRPAVVAAMQSFTAPSQIKIESDTIRIFFARPLDADSACNIANYSVFINGRSVECESGAYNTVTGCVTLGLPQSTLSVGDTVGVSWNELKDRAGAAITGQFGPVVTGQGE